MNLTTVLIGSAAAIYGIVTIALRINKPKSFKKLEAMKDRFGEKGGMAIHVIAYSLLPIVFGLFAISLGMAGESLF